MQDYITPQIEELKKLGEGWHNGEGSSFDPNQLDWIRNWLLENTPNTKKVRIFPSWDESIRVEWLFGRQDTSLEMFLKTRRAIFHSIDLDSIKEDSDIVQCLELDEPIDIKWVKSFLNKLHVKTV